MDKKKEIKNKGSKELNDIFKAINKWANKYKGNIHLILDLCAFKGKEFNVIDDRVLIHGVKSSIRDSLKDLDEVIEKEKEEFISW